MWGNGMVCLWDGPDKTTVDGRLEGSPLGSGRPTGVRGDIFAGPRAIVRECVAEDVKVRQPER
jgi:hypothetical protein